ncbi:bifunctional metallophosphatase/5'-nucleotidase [Pseudomonas sp.]|uniref:bifunctional metallophosphatase/5'-nucleotidase n=1 Tax=Pseudomonas sp. TaxID=306 RepID=UPI0025895438|nr:bifunctional metallophosphatase/5'-nucleotidase [Pseudomonas sp.]
MYRVFKTAALTLALALAGCASAPPRPVAVNIVAINDLHGYLQANGYAYKDANGSVQRVEAGGIATLGGMLDQLRKQDPQLLFIGAGDLVGASPPLSAMWADEPTLLALRGMGLKFSTIGNHELDNGKAEFLRQANGGCQSSRPDKACRFQADFPGGGFPYLAANLIDTDTGKPLLPAYHIETVHGVKVAFVGAVLHDVAKVVSAKGMQGLKATDEADAINAVIPQLKAQGVNAIVAVVHQGGNTPEPFDQPNCSHLQGDIVDVAQRLDPAVDVLISAHSHQGYLCKVGNLLVTQGSSYGHLLTHLTLEVTPGTHQVTAIEAQNLLVDPRKYHPDARMAALQQEVEARSNTVLLRPVGTPGAPAISAAADANGESPLGDLITDAQLAMTRTFGAQIAFTNQGGIRNHLILAPGQTQLTYAQVASVQPFNNTLVLMNLTGAQLQQVLNQQWQGAGFNPLQVSRGFSYRWADNRVVPGSLVLDGKPVRLEQTYRVVMNSFLSGGGDRFSVFQQGTQREDSRMIDLDALLGYLAQQPNAGAGSPAGRIIRVR